MRKSDTYHHGHLREALLATARELLQESGVEALTLREVARRAGVSTAAPYHHFSDKAQLVHALARQSLEDLDRVSREALHGIDDTREKLHAIGTAYVLYAVEHPAEFRLMFRPEMGSPFDSQDRAGAPVYRVLLAVVDELRAHGFGEGDRFVAATTAWSLVHGLAALLVDGPLQTVPRDQVPTLAAEVTKKLAVV